MDNVQEKFKIRHRNRPAAKIRNSLRSEIFERQISLPCA